MKFLIFNIIVFFSLGYLLTSKPNENFKAWFSSSKDKISQISQKEIVSTIKKATSADKLIISDYVQDKKKDKDKEMKIQQQYKNNNLLEKNINNPIAKAINNKDKQVEIKKIIQQVLEERKSNEKNIHNKNITNSNLPKKPDLLAQIKNITDSKIKTANKYMTSQERHNALSELITDMELYHLNNLKN